MEKNFDFTTFSDDELEMARKAIRAEQRNREYADFFKAVAKINEGLAELAEAMGDEADLRSIACFGEYSDEVWLCDIQEWFKNLLPLGCLQELDNEDDE